MKSGSSVCKFFTARSAAIANAIARAIGVEIRTTPFTPERVLRTIRDGEEATAPSLDPAFDLRPGKPLGSGHALDTIEHGMA